ncbi:hypothetical protein HBI56_139290 [Parastagonospora nodorum]|uniref:Uncharacterized protein n=1 Tax=Phaeosphaeria nodorum (strain SN15 / ATCC MYA-4574 / FGSC 10173) TaxID=321614 RepID=A0A7U2I9I4_PHANO|nr:hypothetical protein HBH56_128510 [Parastagonospora nodorum]QRD05660.1 hypothetical protein JI435_422610 [Parastagonospora nodorum SN15]KAH3931447.1 hypothetical protein HBH54_094970 [Parastagonospora nodorum]KAH3947136.1 hypothetical protein HBH53_118810 [Parastagonospora nodorum]KAH3970645.1 hypothetical protein HBH51_115220 [Parastagonospora nodorum]
MLLGTPKLFAAGKARATPGAMDRPSASQAFHVHDNNVGCVGTNVCFGKEQRRMYIHDVQLLLCQ